MLTAEVFAEGSLLSVLAKRSGVDDDEFRSFLGRYRQKARECLTQEGIPQVRRAR